MKILIATDNYYPNVNGAAYSAQRLAYYLNQRGHEVAVIAPSRYPWDEEYKQGGADVYGLKSMNLERIKIARPWSGVRRKIYGIFREFQPDIAHVEGHFAISRKTVAVAKELNLPVVGTNHFMPENFLAIFAAPDFIKRMIRRILWLYFLNVFSTLEGVTSPSRTAADVLNVVGLNKPIRIISNGVDLEKFNPIHKGGYLRERFKMPDRPILLYVGRLDPEKNLDFVIRCLPECLAKVDFQFVIAGLGSEKNHLQALAQNLELSDRITFTGFIPDNDLPNLYAISACFIMPGTAELQSMVTLEAMASGLPIIAVEAVALPELVKNGINGFLYRPGSAWELYGRLVEFFSSPERWKEFSRKSLEMAAEHDIQRAVSEFISFYQEFIKKP